MKVKFFYFNSNVFAGPPSIKTDLLGAEKITGANVTAALNRIQESTMKVDEETVYEKRNYGAGIVLKRVVRDRIWDIDEFK